MMLGVRTDLNMKRVMNTMARMNAKPEIVAVYYEYEFVDDGEDGWGRPI